MDGTDFRTTLRRKEHTRSKSHKFNGPALRYEVAISIFSGDIVHINGPFNPGIVNDIAIFRDKLKDKLKFGVERVEADDGYRGEYHYVDLPKSGCFHDKVGNQCRPGCRGCLQSTKKARLRSRHETCNNRFKTFAILRERYRHGEVLHGWVFRAIVALVQIEIRTGSPLFYCDDTYKTQESNERKMATAELRRNRRRRG